MSGDEAEPPRNADNYPPEDQRRDEVLCRLLNTPYRPRRPQDPAQPQEAATNATPAPTT